MKPNRRTFLAGTSSVGVALAEQHITSTAPSGATGDLATVPFRRYDPVLPPRSSSNVTRIHMKAQEVPLCIRPGTVVAAWTFDGDVPGPIVHVRQGDTVEFTLTNDGIMPHSMNFHCALVDPKTAFRSVARGQSVSFSFAPRYAGAYLYHCGTPPILMHLGSGMYGAIIVDPLTPLPPAKGSCLCKASST
jgi:nitrite reductase (NO-forming)